MTLHLPDSWPRDGNSLRPWLRRVFHNTYTRGGRRIALRGWSVKIQHQGRRHTFSLAAGTRAGAAAEARVIHANILAGGWEAVLGQQRGRRGRAVPEEDACYWKERLLLRNYPQQAGAGREREFSTLVEHAGTGWYFPLGTSDPEAAAVRAVEIYRTVIGGGWEAAARHFAREATLGFHWAHDPLLWTYTTVHAPGAASIPQSDKNLENRKAQTKIMVVESDPGLRSVLSRCIERHEGYRSVACANATAAFRQSAVRRPALCLINRDLAGSLGLGNTEGIGMLAKGIPAVCYGVHTDSEELFARTPGGASGYVLKRTAPERILEPVQAALARSPVVAAALVKTTQSYFQRLLHSGPARLTSSKAAELTPREQDVLSLMSKGHMDKEIGRALEISVWTVREHVKRIFEKLKVHSRTEAVLAYLQK